MKRIGLTIIPLLLLVSSKGFSATAPALTATTKVGISKTGNYLSDGVFSGGDKAIQAMEIKDIRLGTSGGAFERLVLDMTEIPYFQVRVSPRSDSVLLSLWANSSNPAAVSEKKLKTVVLKSKLITSITPVPQVEDRLVQMELKLASSKKVRVETFQLENPPRIIMDFTK